MKKLLPTVTDKCSPPISPETLKWWANREVPERVTPKPLIFDDDVKSSDLTSEPEEGTLPGKLVDLESMEEINNRLFNASRGGKEVKDVKKS